MEFQYNQRNLFITSITASQQPLIAVPEHNTHPVDIQMYKMTGWLSTVNNEY